MNSETVDNNAYDEVVREILFDDDAVRFSHWIKKHPKHVNVSNEGGVRPILTAARTGSLEHVKILLDAGADAFVKDKAGWNILHYAARSQHKKVFCFLKEYGVDSTEKTLQGNGVVDIARLTASEEFTTWVSEYLLSMEEKALLQAECPKVSEDSLETPPKKTTRSL